MERTIVRGKVTHFTSLSIQGSDYTKTTYGRRLDEMLLNLLSWAGLPMRPDGETSIEDGYFEPSDSVRPTLSLVEDPTLEIEREQGGGRY